MNLTQELKQQLIQSEQAYVDWYFNGGKEEAKNSALKLVKEEVNKIKYKDYKITDNELNTRNK